MRGDLYRLKAPRQVAGHEKAGARYAVVVQSSVLNLSTVLVAPTSTSAPPRMYRPEIGINGTTTRVIVEQTTCVDMNRLGDFAGRLDAHEMEAVDRALRDVLDLF